MMIERIDSVWLPELWNKVNEMNGMSNERQANEERTNVIDECAMKWREIDWKEWYRNGMKGEQGRAGNHTFMKSINQTQLNEI